MSGRNGLIVFVLVIKYLIFNKHFTILLLFLLIRDSP